MSKFKELTRKPEAKGKPAEQAKVGMQKKAAAGQAKKKC